MVIDSLYAVYEDLQVIAHSFDAVFVPGIVFESGLGLGLVLEAYEPAPAAFVVQATGPFTVGGVDLSLISPELVLLEMAAKLEAAVAAFRAKNFAFQNKILVGFFRHQKEFLTAREDDLAIGHSDFTPVKGLGPA